MKYFIDTEFIEGPQRLRFRGIPLLGLRWDSKDMLEIFKPYTLPTIDLISIGIVAEDGREFYEVSKDFNLKEAWNRFQIKETGTAPNMYGEVASEKVYWLRNNVLKTIWREWLINSQDEWFAYAKKEEYDLFLKCVANGDYDKTFTYSNFKKLLAKYGKSNKEIADSVIAFCTIGSAHSSLDRSISSKFYFKSLDKDTKSIIKHKGLKYVFNEVPEFYAYYADYDWVVFCWLFGKMMDLPDGFPMYCKDLKQLFDDKAENLVNTDVVEFDFRKDNQKLVKSSNVKDYIYAIKNHSGYPKQKGNHSAIDDARWNKELFNFLRRL